MRPLSILIIEDDETNAELLRKIAHHHDPAASVEWARNGLDALARVEDLHPDLIFLDYRMPRLDGRDFLLDLRRQGGKKGSFIVLGSGYVDPGNESAFLSMGADVVVAKPFEIERIEGLLAQVEQAKDRRESLPR